MPDLDIVNRDANPGWCRATRMYAGGAISADEMRRPILRPRNHWESHHCSSSLSSSICIAATARSGNDSRSEYRSVWRSV